MKMREHHPMTIRSGSDHSIPECDQVRTWLREYNWSENRTFMELMSRPDRGAEPLVLIAETASEPDAPAGMIGGLIAETQLSWLRISIMATDPEWRSRGIGRTLLTEAERLAIDRGCSYSYVDTMSYQAPGFYEGCSYQQVGAIPDWDSQGNRKLFFVKRLI